MKRFAFNPRAGLIVIPVRLWRPAGATRARLALDTGVTSTVQRSVSARRRAIAREGVTYGVLGSGRPRNLGVHAAPRGSARELRETAKRGVGRRAQETVEGAVRKHSPLHSPLSPTESCRSAPRAAARLRRTLLAR